MNQTQRWRGSRRNRGDPLILGAVDGVGADPAPRRDVFLRRHGHVNSVKYRLARAMSSDVLRPITDDRDVEVALLLCHWYDAAVIN